VRDGNVDSPEICLAGEQLPVVGGVGPDREELDVHVAAVERGDDPRVVMANSRHAAVSACGAVAAASRAAPSTSKECGSQQFPIRKGSACAQQTVNIRLSTGCCQAPRSGWSINSGAAGSPDSGR